VKQMVSILLRKEDDTLVRLTGLLYRRGYLVESLSVVPDRQIGHSRVTAVVSSQRAAPRQLVNYVSKLVDVVEAKLEPCEA